MGVVVEVSPAIGCKPFLWLTIEDAPDLPARTKGFE